MSADTGTSAPRTASALTSRALLLWIAGSVVIGITVVGTVIAGEAVYRQIDRGVPGLATSLTSSTLTAIAFMAGIVAVGDVVTRTFVIPRRERARLSLNAFSELRVARTAALVWAAAAAALVCVDAADSNGVALSRLFTPGALSYLFTASYDPGAWLVTTVCACVIFGLTFAVRRWDGAVYAIPVAFIGLLAPIAVGQVLVGPNHDFGGDASFLAVPALATWFGVTVALALRSRRVRLSRVTIRRYAALSSVLGVCAVGGTLVVALFELDSAAWGSPTGLLFGGQLLVLVGLSAVSVLLWRAIGRGRNALPGWFFALALPAMAVCIGLIQVGWRVPPPVFFANTTTQDLFFGYGVNSPPSVLSAFADWRINLLFFVPTLAAAAVYLVGVRRLRRRGDEWPALRTAAWLAGCLVIILTTSSSLGPYASASFSAHMIFHMSLNMLAPLLLVMGGPITLALRATKASRPSEPSGPHEWITAMLHSSLTRKLYNPLLVLVEFIGSYYVIYFTPLFGWAMRYHWAHQLMNVHFLIVGYLFYSLIAGVDRPPRPLPYIGKLAMVLAAMPFHAFFGVIVMTQSTVIGDLFYHYIDIPWDHNLLHDQYVAGGIAWAAGELPLIVVVVALVTQWSKSDQKDARQRDRQIESGLDGSFDAYNEMLARLNDRQAR